MEVVGAAVRVGETLDLDSWKQKASIECERGDTGIDALETRFACFRILLSGIIIPRIIHVYRDGLLLA